MLTDDGKHLYVSWDEYHMLIERLALKVHASGWEFDQILCLARGRHAAGRRAVTGLRQAAGDHVDQFVPLGCRHHPGPAGHGQVHHHAQGRAGRARAAGRRPGRHRRDLAGGGRPAARHAGHQRTACGRLWVKGVSSYTPDYYCDVLPTSPWIHQPFEEYDNLRPDKLAKKFAV
jgi:hypothetical protein